MTNEFRQRYDEARSAWSEWRTRALEDLRFSNPAKPEQWAEDVIRVRGRSRPALVFDQTNQYIGQVVNDARQNKPGIEIMAGDDLASDEAADALSGIVRQIEYASRAPIAYDTAIEYAARIGLGFLLVVPELVNSRTNDHDIRIKAVVDPLSATLDPDSIEPDGQDADVGWLETNISEASFKRRWPKGKIDTASGGSWFDGKTVKVCQFFERTYEQENRILTQDGRDFNEDDYHAENQRTGIIVPVHTTFVASTPKVVWQWLSGEEVLEETIYPAPYIGLIPVYGNILWVEGKRQICGMTRRMMDGQKAYNYERSAYIEAVALSPKAPWTAAAKAIGKFQAIWDNSNVENRAVLPWTHEDENGRPIPEPKRQAPPMPGAAYAENAQMALNDIQASVGMYKANLGQNSNAKSGIAINRLQTEGDTSTFHYIDNLSRSVEQVGRVTVALIPTYYDRAKVARILGVDGKPASVRINPQLPMAHAEPQPGVQGDMLQINPAVGEYAVRVKAGPSYTTMRQELADKLTQLGQSNPPLAAALAPLILQMADVPGADKAIEVAKALLPPAVRSVYDEDGPQVPPQILQHMQGLQQQNQQLAQMLQGAQGEVQKLKLAEQQKFNEQLIDAYEAETGRIAAIGKALGMDPQLAIQLIQQVVAQALATPSPAAMVDNSAGMPPGPMPPPMQPTQANPQQPPPGGFFAPGAQPPQPVTPPAMAATGAQPGLGPQSPL